MSAERERLVWAAKEARGIQSYWNEWYPFNFVMRLLWMLRAIRAERALAAYDAAHPEEAK